MQGISEFFKRIQRLHMRDVVVREAIRKAIFTHTGADIPPESISFSRSEVVLKGVSSSVRSAIFIKKESILSDIAQNQNFRFIHAIR